MPSTTTSRPTLSLTRGLLGTTAVLAAGLSGLYLRHASPKLPSALPLLRSYSSSSPPPFTYRLAAAASAKRSAPPRPAQFWPYSSAAGAQAPPYVRSTKPDAGEDAFFMATVGGDAHTVAFGVADGVGGWQDSGVDPSDFSHGLCGLMAGTAHIFEGAGLRPRELMQTAYDAVIGNPRIVAGGCTASLGVLDGEGGLEAANLGDSGFVIVSPGKIAFRSEMQTHAFNTPYQMSKVPPKMQAQHAIFGGSTHFSETPQDADVTKHKVQHGDIVLFATDGVWDNLSAQDVLKVVTKVMEEQGYWNEAGGETTLNETKVRSLPGKVSPKTQESYLPGLLASAVMREAKLAGLDTKRNGPFAREVKLYYPHEAWQGGKPDDIAVVVAVAVENGPLADEKPIKAKL